MLHYIETGAIWVDGKKKEFIIIPDYIVEKNGAVGIVEVKSGGSAPDPLFSSARRQLFEYQNIFKSHDLYLLDMEKEKLFKIDFFPNEKRYTVPLTKLSRIFIGGYIAGLLSLSIIYLFFK